MKRFKVFSFIIAAMMVALQVIGTLGITAKAIETGFSADILIEGYSGVIAEGRTTKANAAEALEEILKGKNISYDLKEASWGGKYISSIADLKEKEHFDGKGGWMYAIKSSGKYMIPMTSIDTTVLKNGDKLIVYYAAWGTTYLANKIEYSTALPNKELFITINNTDTDWQTGKEVVTPISNIKAKIDGKEVSVEGNKIDIKEGLSIGRHILELSDFHALECPKVVYDSFEISIDYPAANVRIEGLSSTIAEGSDKGKNALEIAEKVLKKNNISFDIQISSYGSYLSSIGGLKEKKFGGWDGWMYYVKRQKEIIAPMTMIEGYVPEEGDNIIIYYSSGTTPYVNNITFTPEIIKENSSFSMRFSYKYKDWNTGKDVDTPISNAIVTIDKLNYITNEKGEISAAGLSSGEHTYSISGYNIDKTPTVVMDKGTFLIDNTNAPMLNYGDESYDNFSSKDNSKIKKDLVNETNVSIINTPASYIKNNAADPWAFVTLNKLNEKPDEGYIKQTFSDVQKNGIKDYGNTELEKLIIALTAAGYNPYNFAGTDLVKELLSRDINTFLVNDAAFALIAYNYANINGNYKITRERLVEYLLINKVSYKLTDGRTVEGWPLIGDKINPDITGIVINALSTYYDKDVKVKDAVDKAVQSLSSLQNESGYIADSFGIFSESLSFTILGLTSIGVNPEGTLFTKTKGDLVSALLSFRTLDGRYKHSAEGNGDHMATEQALRALLALKEFKKNGRYNFYDSKINSSTLPVYEEIKKDENILPKTGHILDLNALAAVGLSFILTGLFIGYKKRKLFTRG